MRYLTLTAAYALGIASILLWQEVATPRVSALSAIEAQAKDCFALGRALRSMAAESTEVEFIADIERKQ